MLCFCLKIACIAFGEEKKFNQKNEIKEKYKYITKYFEWIQEYKI